MTSNEERVLKIIKDSGGKVRSLRIAKELRISSGYARLIFQSLHRRGKIEFSNGWLSLPKKEIEETVKPHKVKKSKKPKKKKAKTSLTALRVMTRELEKSLQKAGYKNVEALAQASISRLMEKMGLELKAAADLINEARRELKIILDVGHQKKK